MTSFPPTPIFLRMECLLTLCVCFAGKTCSLHLMSYDTVSWPRIFSLSFSLMCGIFFYDMQVFLSSFKALELDGYQPQRRGSE